MTAAISQAALIQQLNTHINSAPHLWFVVGESGTGKTHWCQTFMVQAQRAGLLVGGVLSQAIMVNGQKVAIDLLDVQNNERRRLAILYAWPGALSLSLTLHQGRNDLLPTAGRWRFDPVTLAWGNRVLRQSSGADLLFVDEIGQLEFRQQGGFQAAMQMLDTAEYRAVCLALRPKLLAQAQQRWPTGQVIQEFPAKRHL